MENDWTKVLGFPGYRVYQQEIDEEHQQLKLWIRRKRGNRSMTCAGCGSLIRCAEPQYPSLQIRRKDVRDPRSWIMRALWRSPPAASSKSSLKRPSDAIRDS